MPVKKKKESTILFLLRVLSPMIALFVFHLFISYVVPLYFWITWFDNVMHFSGGFVTAWSAWIAMSHYIKKRQLKISPEIAILLFLVGTVAIVGILWEVYEFLLDVYFPNPYFLNQPSLMDTMGDLVLDLWGALVFSCLRVFFKK